MQSQECNIPGMQKSTTHDFASAIPATLTDGPDVLWKMGSVHRILNVHANTCVRANQLDRLKHLVKYLARPPLANEPFWILATRTLGGGSTEGDQTCRALPEVSQHNRRKRGISSILPKAPRTGFKNDALSARMQSAGQIHAVGGQGRRGSHGTFVALEIVRCLSASG